jgi:hypothetical protein
VGSIRIAHQAIYGDEWSPTSSEALDTMSVGQLEENGTEQPFFLKFTNFLSSKNVVLSGNKFFSIFVDLDLSGIQRSLNEYPTY